MLNKSSLCFQIFFIFFYLFSKSAFLDAKPLSCDVSAPIAILINLEDGKVLFEKNADMPWIPSSTTKIATALYALYQKRDALDQIVKASANAVSIVPIDVRRNSGKHPSYRLEYGGTHMSLKPGEEMDFKSLLYGLLLSSGNDAANVIAEFVSGSVPQFMVELGQFLKEIGCHSTYYHNPHGLPDSNHKTTARDLAIMARIAMQDPIFKEIVATPKYTRPVTNKSPESLLVQGNALVRPKHKYYYPYATGIKTGWTIKSKHNLVASAQKGDRNVIAVVLGCDDLAKRYRSAVQLFEAAFEEPKEMRKLFSKEHDFFSQKIKGAKESISGFLAEDVVVFFYPSEDQSFTSNIVWNKKSLPILPGEEVGQMQIFDKLGKLVESVAILSSKKVSPTFSYQVEEHLASLIFFLQSQRNYFGYGFACVLFVMSFLLVRKRVKVKVK